MEENNPTNKPTLEPGQWISVGEPSAFSYGLSAVVCRVCEEYDRADYEVVYLDDRNRAINEVIVWDGNYWRFKNQGGVGGGYADKYDRLREYVSILRAGRKRF